MTALITQPHRPQSASLNNRLYSQQIQVALSRKIEDVKMEHRSDSTYCRLSPTPKHLVRQSIYYAVDGSSVSSMNS